MKNQHLIDNLSTSEKADLFQHLYAELAGQGTDGDTELAHVNRFEAQVLRNIGGSGTVNKVTGLRQYGKGGSAPPPPSSTTTRQVPEYAPEQREYIEDIFGKSQELYEQRSEEGFTPFPGQQLAPFAAQETEAFGGIESLARGPGAAPAFGIARNAALGAAAPITAGEVQQGMNPYQQAVTDIGKREAVRQYQRGPQAQLRSGAVESGGLRGARRFIEEGEGQRNLNQQLGDIQTLGSQQAFQQSMAEAAAARGRLANLATQMPSIGMGAYNQQMQQLGQLGGVGEAYRSRDQAAIGLAQDQFQQEQMFPEETLATYLRFITNAPSPSGFQRTTQAPGIAGPGTMQQLAGLGLSGAATGKAFGLFSRGGAVPPASGRQAGLSGIVRRASGGQIVRMSAGGLYPDTTNQVGKRQSEFDRAVANPSYKAGSPLQDMSALYNDIINGNDFERAAAIKEQAEKMEQYNEYATKDIRAGLTRDGITLEGGISDPFEDALDRPGIENLLNRGSLRDPTHAEAGVGLSLMPTGLKQEIASSEATVVEETTPSQEPAAGTEPEKKMTLAEEYSAYRKLMEGDEEETGLSWPERLQIASALFGAADTPSTGSFLGDLSQFGAQVSPGVAKGLAARDARELASKKRRIKSVKDFRQFVREEKLDAREAVKLAAELGYTQAKTAEIVKNITSPDIETKIDNQTIAAAQRFLDGANTTYDKTKLKKGALPTIGTADYQLATIAATLKMTPSQAYQRAKAADAVYTDPKTGKTTINIERVITGRTSRPVEQVTRAEGGLVDDRSILRYPEDF